MASSIKGNVWRMFIHVVAVATSFPFIPFILLFSLSPPLKFHSFVSFPSFKWLIFFLFANYNPLSFDLSKNKIPNNIAQHQVRVKWQIFFIPSIILQQAHPYKPKIKKIESNSNWKKIRKKTETNKKKPGSKPSKNSLNWFLS